MQGELHEECGVFGVYRLPGAAGLTYLGLHALQHRGQESAGIAVSDGHSLRCLKDRGLVTEALLTGRWERWKAITLSATCGIPPPSGDEWENIQPMVARAKVGSLAVVHNGQIANAQELRDELEEQGSIFHGTSDSEILLHLIQRGHGTLLEKAAGRLPEAGRRFCFSGADGKKICMPYGIATGCGLCQSPGRETVIV